MSIRRIAALLSMCSAAIFSAPASPASPPTDRSIERGEVAFRQALLDMGTDLRLMCVAAHPDDEDDATLAMYRMAYGLKTFAVIATRGEGGQNEIGPELGAELGVIRTREMTAAAQIIGAELHFLDLPEFGFSKSIDETYAIWGRKEALRRMVRVIRQCQPDVIITHHGRMKDHGHHQAIGATLIEAFDAAADEAVFPEHLAEGLLPWQAARLYIRAWEPTSTSVTIDISQYDRLRGKTYAEIAAEALGVHKSQGMEFFINRYRTGRPKAYYDLVKSSSHAPAHDGPLPAPDAALLRGMHDRVARADRALSISSQSRESLAPKLLRRATALARKRDESERARRTWSRANNAAVHAMELEIGVHPAKGTVVPGETVPVRVRITDFGERDATSAVCSLNPEDGFDDAAASETTVDLASHFESEAATTVAIPANAAYTLPAAEYLKEAHASSPQFAAESVVQTPNGTVTLYAPLRFEIAAPIDVTPVQPKVLVLTDGPHATTLHFRVVNNAPGAAEGTLMLSAAPALELSANRIPVTFARTGDQQTIAVRATFRHAPAVGDYHVAAAIEGSNRSTGTVIRVAEVALPEHVRIGVIQSYDDTFMQTLDTLDVPHEAIALFSPEYLDTFTTILVDIRAYLVREDMRAQNTALLDYVQRGGNMIVMYQKTFEWLPEYAPYPMQISTARVTREDAPISVIVPDHPFFTTPNRIRATDWDGWVHERGLYFASQWDSHYTPLIACADPGENTAPGSLLVAKYGAGHYSYTALVWYRQLRELHPGALRMFANMIAMGSERQ